TSRYWDCCLPSCSVSNNTHVSKAVKVCKKDGTTFRSFTKNDISCGSNNDNLFMCNNNQPWALTNNLSYGFASAFSNIQTDKCCTCYRLQFTSTKIKGKQMVVQVTNTSGDNGNSHFDIQIPGGGFGIFDGCSVQWNTPTKNWGIRYGGVESIEKCNQLPTALQNGCKWRFNWFENVENPKVVYERVQCPKELTNITGCIPNDDTSQKKLPWVN
ncbi:glycoside hydrolase family 45 protein, partial [Piromyces sp. E2]